MIRPLRGWRPAAAEPIHVLHYWLFDPFGRDVFLLSAGVAPGEEEEARRDVETLIRRSYFWKKDEDDSP